ncbi:enoyl-CoA hydratase/Enoyl-CoA isomerase/3-hydroxyacyl-CoA dehydrogenase, putative [Anopheles sinensis]|uniref:Enoyl-CoA hydratase/Enoyl-CoA isomerase/3-hydroxyacyl-CoA dehydrogenase, putative n=1 Tax=Anopheles sinensis TaxID=74873 RepID=A0A084VI66_ANOSI|nr:enoyl-CoA hydratase/Enoyl-CoA isomerase/3-hydroxyacyl-CoA dehydrogenase, putative [Anopheles sinensis]
MSTDRLLLRNHSEDDSLVGTPISKSPSLASIREGLTTRRDSYCSLASYSTGTEADGGGSAKKRPGKCYLSHFFILIKCCQK